MFLTGGKFFTHMPSLQILIELQLVGKIGEKTVVTENYVVSANCCHTYLVKGDKEVVVKDKELQ